MKYLKSINEFKTISTEFFKKFSDKDIPKKIIFDEPSIEYSYVENTLHGPNQISAQYKLESEPDSNPYDGTFPTFLYIELSFTYNGEKKGIKENLKLFLRITGGQKDWLTLSIENNEIDEIQSLEGYKISQQTLDQVMDIYKKYKQ